MYAHVLRGRIQKELKIQVSFVKGPGAEGKKKIFPQKSENVWMWPFSKGNICPFHCKTKGFLYGTDSLPPPNPKPSQTQHFSYRATPLFVWPRTPSEMPAGPAEAPGELC